MTKSDKDNDGAVHNATDDDQTFDMYHIYSRWDFWLILVFVLGLILFALYSYFTAGGSA